jgi:putative transport protein
MDWLIDLFQGTSVAHTVLIISLATACGLALGSIRVWGISLGIGGILFAGLIFGHFKFVINEEVLGFIRDFGLILFVYSIGIQVGPGFFASLRREGLPLNIMAASVVILGVLMTILLHLFANISMPVAVGIYPGATTNTPALAAVEQALKDIKTISPDALKTPGLGFAIAYPFGILGVILVMILIRLIFRINPHEEDAEFRKLQTKSTALPATMHLEVKNPNLHGLPLEKIPMLDKFQVVISRIHHEGKVHVAQPDTILHLGNTLLAVGPKDQLEELCLIIGEKSNMDLRAVPSKITTKRILVTHRNVLGKTLDELDFLQALDVTITRVSRADIEFTPSSNFRLQFGDTVLVVGEVDAIAKVTNELGNSLKQLNHPQLIPVLIGIALGVIVGSFPFFLPGVPAPVRLGLAGGPLLVAILLSRVGQVGPLNWYMPISANFMLRELGICLFLVAVGLKAGDQFVYTLVHGGGLYWMGCATLITLVPLFIVGMVARAVFKLNYMSLCGLLTGSMTIPPALSYSSSIAGSDSPNIGYATVYPLVMLLRVLTAQLLVLFLSN